MYRKNNLTENLPHESIKKLTNNCSTGLLSSAGNSDIGQPK